MSYRNATSTTTSSYAYQTAFPSTYDAGDVMLKGDPGVGSRVRQVSQKASVQRPSRYNRTSGNSSSELGSPPAGDIEVIRYPSDNGIGFGAAGRAERTNGIGRLMPDARFRNEISPYDFDDVEERRLPSPGLPGVRNSTTRKTTTTTVTTTSGERPNGWSSQRSSLRSSPQVVNHVSVDSRSHSPAVSAVSRSSPKRDASSPSTFSDILSPPAASRSARPTPSPTNVGSETVSNGRHGLDDDDDDDHRRGVGKLTVFSGQDTAGNRHRTSPTREVSEQRELFARIQRELDDQRATWKPEIDRLTRSAAAVGINDDDARGERRNANPREAAEAFASSRSSGRRFSSEAASATLGNDDDYELHKATVFDAETSSYVDTSGPQAIFKAFVDVSEFSPDDVDVHVDSLASRVVVEASADLPPRHGGGPAQCRTFTQRIQLPRFADESNMVARMNKQGILKIEVPLIFYNPPPSERCHDYDSKAKAFVYEVRDDPRDPRRQLMEILVNTGVDATARDLRVEIEGDRLAIYADPTVSGAGLSPGAQRRLIKSFTLPPSADVGGITSRLGRDGRLTVLIPLIRK